MKLRRERIFAPYPELIDPGEAYQVLDSDDLNVGKVNVDRRVMLVPLFDCQDAVATRHHEMAHTAWTPRGRVAMLDALEAEFPFETSFVGEKYAERRAAGLDGADHDTNMCACEACWESASGTYRWLLAMTLSAVEDARIERGLELCRIPTEHSEGRLEAIEKEFEALAAGVEQNGAWRAVFMAVSACTQEQMRSRALPQKALPPGSPLLKHVQEVIEIIHKHELRRVGKVPHTDALLEATRYIIRQKLSYWPGQQGGGPYSVGNLCKDEEVIVDAAAQSEWCDGTGDERVPSAHDVKKKMKWGKYVSACAPHVFTRLPLRVPIVGARRARKPTGVDEGAQVRYVHRWPTDGRIFAKRRWREGVSGSVLIDRSGSMGWHIDTLLDLVRQIPAGTIAMYSGKGQEEPGDLALLAQRGKRASDHAIVEMHRKMGGGNDIDMACLDWLTQQPGPHFWVSDGCASGSEKLASAQGVSPIMAQACAEFCNDYGIRRRHTIPEVIDLLKKHYLAPEEAERTDK